MARARLFTSSKSSSIEGSFVVLFSQCQRRGPGVRIGISPFIHQWAILFHFGVRLTNVYPDPAGREDAVDDAEVVDNIFRLGGWD